MEYNLILVRHGQSTYNLENKFTGWKDVDLTEKGVKEAIECAKLLNNINISVSYTSNLKRAQKTLSLILGAINQKPSTIINKSLNERDYGDLIGKNKADTAEKYGDKQVEIWRRSYDTPPPNGESLKMTCERVIPYFKNVILKEQKENNYKNILIAAHGNSIRAIIMFLLNLTPELILKTEVGWCEPWIFTFKNNNLNAFKILTRQSDKSMSYLPVELTF